MCAAVSKIDRTVPPGEFARILEDPSLWIRFPCLVPPGRRTPLQFWTRWNDDRRYTNMDPGYNWRRPAENYSHLPPCSLNYYFRHSMTRAFTDCYSFTHSFVRSFVHSFIHSFIHSFYRMHKMETKPLFSLISWNWLDRFRQDFSQIDQS
jgi:hypothetical protein